MTAYDLEKTQPQEYDCPRECAFCRHFCYLQETEPTGVCELSFDEWEERNNGQVSCGEALDWFTSHITYDGQACYRTEFEVAAGVLDEGIPF